MDEAHKEMVEWWKSIPEELREGPYDRSTIVPAILQRMAGGESLRQICRDADMPNRETVRAWMAEDAALSGQYAHAREDRGDYYADKVIEVIAQTPPFVADTNHKAGEGRMDSAFVAWQRVQADNYKWIAARLHPGAYGDKIVQEHTGPGGGPV